MKRKPKDRPAPAATVTNMQASEGLLVTTFDGRWMYMAWSWGQAEMGYADSKPDGLRLAATAFRSFGAVLT